MHPLVVILIIFIEALLTLPSHALLMMMLLMMCHRLGNDMVISMGIYTVVHDSILTRGHFFSLAQCGGVF